MGKGTRTTSGCRMAPSSQIGKISIKLLITNWLMRKNIAKYKRVEEFNLNCLVCSHCNQQ